MSTCPIWQQARCWTLIAPRSTCFLLRDCYCCVCQSNLWLHRVHQLPRGRRQQEALLPGQDQGRWPESARGGHSGSPSICCHLLETIFYMIKDGPFARPCYLTTFDLNFTIMYNELNLIHSLTAQKLIIVCLIFLNKEGTIWLSFRSGIIVLKIH